MPIEFPKGFPFTKRSEELADPAHAELVAAPIESAPAARVEAPTAAPAPRQDAPIAPPAPRLEAAGARQPSGAAERRRASRQTLVARATIRTDNPLGPGGPTAAGYVSNISMLGISFHTRRPLAVGERYHLKLEVGPMKWTSRLRVVTCHPHETGTWDVGAEFVSNELNSRGPRELAA